MSTGVSLLTASDFLQRSRCEENDQVREELIAGEIVEMPPPLFSHDLVKNVVADILGEFLRKRQSGRVFVEMAFQIDDYHCLIPDVSIIRRERLHSGITGIFSGGPDLAVEVISTEGAVHLQHKILEYLNHGARAVWAVYVEDRYVHVFLAGQQTVRVLQLGDTIEEPILLPGFAAPISSFFEGL